ncbi:hypothetical protein OIDMADRAFT_154862 [Oidiodendron maius Zn]|uniref:ferric-chelate reductase (NADPH) n=1 Tax=Oidiodendron maius (strain Zn) TaxID=913774 RepID=A0A0C3HST9_OIDMZ|nr:hypothetical protein OIDMADRAFT_154862 [Oidiodendron maius Zn]
MAQISSAQQAAPPTPSTPEASAAAALQANADTLNKDFYDYVFIVLSSLILGLAIWRIGIESVKYARTLICLNNERQLYFVKPSAPFASFKKHFLYAPIFRKRHNREFQLSAAVNVGTLPTRFQLLFIVAYLGTNIAYCVVGIDWSQPSTTVLKELRNRTGILAVTNLIPQFILAARNNPLINVLNISFDSFNLLHRWFGRIVVLEVIAHTTSYAIYEVRTAGWKGLEKAITNGSMTMYGFIGFVAVVTIAIMSNSIFRHAFYETFKLLHMALVILVIIVIWFHLRLSNIPQITILYGVVALWVTEHLLRATRVLYRNRGGSKAVVEALPGNACRVTIAMARPWSFKPGQHAYLYIPSLGLWTSHPFSVAWSQETEILDPDEKLAMNRQDILAMQKTSLSFIVRARTGFTNTLYQRALASTDGRFTANCVAEGPYGGMHMMHSYGTVMLIAGGVGITHQVPHVRDLVAGYANGTVAVRRLVLIWIIQSPEHLEWIRPWMTSILAMEKRRDVLRIMLFVTRPRSTKEIHSPSATVQMFPGRPNIEALMDIEMENQVGAMGVSVCGSGDLSDDVRRAVRTRQHAANIDFVEESFSW